LSSESTGCCVQAPTSSSPRQSRQAPREAADRACQTARCSAQKGYGMKNCPGEVEPGHVGEGSKAANCSPPIAPPGPDQQPADPRAAILLRAAARYDLLHAGEIDLATAFSPDFVDDFLSATNACPCQCAQHQHFDRFARALREERLRRW